MSHYEKTNETALKLPGIVATLAAHFNEVDPDHKWAMKGRPDWGGYAQLVRDDDLRIGLSADGERVKYNPATPKDINGASMSLRSWGAVPYGDHGPGGSFAVDRTASYPGLVIVSTEIWTKVIEPYIPMYSAIIERQREAVDRVNAMNDQVSRIINAAAPYATIRKPWNGSKTDAVLIDLGGTLAEHGISGTITVHCGGGSVDIALQVKGGIAEGLASRMAGSIARMDSDKAHGDLVAKADQVEA